LLADTADRSTTTVASQKEQTRVVAKRVIASGAPQCGQVWMVGITDRRKVYPICAVAGPDGLLF
jgi:hypothetical protein